jgi:ubiquitin C-terminal hydrolase
MIPGVFSADFIFVQLRRKQCYIYLANFSTNSAILIMTIPAVSGALKAFIKSEKLTDGNEWICDGCKKKVHVRTLLK